MHTIEAHNDLVMSAIYNENDHTLISGGFDRTLKLHKLIDKKWLLKWATTLY